MPFSVVNVLVGASNAKLLFGIYRTRHVLERTILLLLRFEYRLLKRQLEG